MLLFGVFLIFVGSYSVLFLIKHKILQNVTNWPISYEFIVTVIVFSIIFIIYYIVQSMMYRKISKDIVNLNEKLDNFDSKNGLNLELKTPLLQKTFNLLKGIIDTQIQIQNNLKQKSDDLKFKLENLQEIVDNEKVLIFKINKNGKVIKANKATFELLNCKNENNINLKYRTIKDIFDNSLQDNWIEIKAQNVKIGNKKYLMYISNLYNKLEYVLTLVEISEFDKKYQNLKNDLFFVNKNLKTMFALKKSFEILMIKITNYDNYAKYLSDVILEILEEKFTQKIISLGYQDVFKIYDGVFAVYDLNVPFEKYKKILEEPLYIKIAGDEYIFNPIVILGSGVNFEQAKQQIIEASENYKLKIKDNFKYNLKDIKLLTNAIKEDKILMGYYQTSDASIIIYPYIKDNYNDQIKDILELSEEFNFYLLIIKQLFLKYMNDIKDKKIIININSKTLLARSLLSELLSLIQREELKVVFNIEINSNYKVVLPIIKSIKAYAQIGFRNLGNSFVNFKDIYLLKIEYLEIDDSIVELIKNDINWKFLLDVSKMLVSEQNTKLLINTLQVKDNKFVTINNKLIFKS